MTAGAPASWSDVLKEAVAFLSSAGVEAPWRDARLLLAHLLATDAAGLMLRDREPAQGRPAAAFRSAIRRRAEGEPVSRILGRRGFHAIELEIDPHVLDPRPETELLVHLAIEALPQGGRLLDLGCGSGAIVLSVLAARPDATGVGVERSPGAAACTRRNAIRLGLSGRLQLVEADWSTLPVAALGPFDVVASNPPYIPTADIPGLQPEVHRHDPHEALDGGADGLAALREIATIAARLAAPGGIVATEIGCGQAAAVERLFNRPEYTDVQGHKDLAGRERVVAARRSREGERGGSA